MFFVCFSFQIEVTCKTLIRVEDLEQKTCHCEFISESIWLKGQSADRSDGRLEVRYFSSDLTLCSYWLLHFWRRVFKALMILMLQCSCRGHTFHLFLICEVWSSVVFCHSGFPLDTELILLESNSLQISCQTVKC